MKYLFFICLVFITCPSLAQIPKAEIEGRLSLYLPSDTTSVHIGKGVGLSQDVTSIRFNTFIGSLTGKRTTYGSLNTFVGKGAGQENISGSSNSFFGMDAGNINETGAKNSFIGFRSGIANTFGSQNSFFGGDSGFFMDGHDNVLLGYRSGWRTNGSGNILIGYYAGPNSSSQMTTTPLNNELYIHNDHTPAPLIYGQFDNKIVRINGEFETEDGSIFMRNLGNTDTDQGIKWGESSDTTAFGLIYDGEGTGGGNSIHFREYIDGQSDLMTIQANGNVGIGTTSPNSKLHVNGIHTISRDDAQQLEITNAGPGGDTWRISSSNDNWNSGGGKFLIGTNSNTINARLAINGDGNVGIGTTIPGAKLEVDGKINVGNDSQDANAGDIRFNPVNNDFEGYDGSTWHSLTGNSQMIYTLNIGAGEIMIDKNDDEDFDISLAFGYTTFTSNFATDGYMYCPLILPEGSTIIEVTYNYFDGRSTDDMTFELKRYNQSSGTANSFYSFTSSDVSLMGFETHSITTDHVLLDDHYYTFVFTLRNSTSSSDYDAQKIQGVQVKYRLP